MPQLNHTLMEHEDHGIREVPLNEWAKYRRAGWTFCNDKAQTVAQAEAAEAEEAAAEPAPKRRTKPKAEEE